jgi:hypothetical protein
MPFEAILRGSFVKLTAGGSVASAKDRAVAQETGVSPLQTQRVKLAYQEDAGRRRGFRMGGVRIIPSKPRR